MKKFKKAVLLILVSALFCACPDYSNWHRDIYLINNTDKEIALQMLFSNKSENKWECDGPGIYIPTTVGANSILKHSDAKRSPGWEGSLNQGQILNILVADCETYDKYWREPCDTMRKYVPILHHYKLKLEDLQRMNWTVVYPPEK